MVFKHNMMPFDSNASFQLSFQHMRQLDCSNEFASSGHRHIPEKQHIPDGVRPGGNNLMLEDVNAVDSNDNSGYTLDNTSYLSWVSGSNGEAVRLEHSKRPFGDGENLQVAAKRTRQMDGNLSPFSSTSEGPFTVSTADDELKSRKDGAVPGDVSNQIICIAAVGERDYTAEFTTDEVFESKDALISWARAQGKKYNMVIIILRSDKGGGDHNRRPRIRFGCERHGQYRESKSDTSSLKSDADSRMQKRPKCNTKKCGCPFALRGVNIGNGDEWKVEVICGEHNHPPSKYPSKHLEGHSFAGRLSKKEDELLVDMSTSLVRPKHILSQIKKKDASNVSTMKTIYNARQRHRVKDKASSTEIQILLSKLVENNYIECRRCSDAEDTVRDLFWTHPVAVDLLRAFPHVLLMDCTYKTNKYRRPLLEIVGVTSTGITFSAAFVYIEAKEEENFTWALTQLRTFLSEDCHPGVIVTDRELALMNAIASVFPTTRHLLCRWHISREVLANCKQMFSAKGMWDKFISLWHCLMNSETEDEYRNHLHVLEVEFSTYPDAIGYLKSTWLNAYSERFVGVWTDMCMHLGNTTTNRVESAHAKLKRQLGSSQHSFKTSWDQIHALLELQHTHIMESFEKSRYFVHKRPDFKELTGYVSTMALDMIACEANRVDSIGESASTQCGCAIRRTHQLPCAHEIDEYRQQNQPIPIDLVHPHWRKLDLKNKPHSVTKSDAPIESTLDRLKKWMDRQTGEIKRHVCLKLEELMNPEVTCLSEPLVKTKSQGRLSTDDTSTYHLPSAFEIVLSGQDSHSPVSLIDAVGVGLQIEKPPMER